MKKIKSYITTFYFSITAITFFALSVFIFLSLFSDVLITNKEGPEKIYFADNISASHKIAIEKFNELHKGKIEVVPIDLPFDKFSTNERKELLIRYLRGKSERLDIFSVDQIWVPRFAKYAVPLGKDFSIVERENIIPEALQSCLYNGEFIAVPLFFDIGVMYYRKDILEKLEDYKLIKNKLDNSITWEEFIELGLRLKDDGIPFYLFAGDAYEGLMCNFIELVASQNADIIENNKIKLTTSKIEKALQLMVDLVNKYNLTPPDVVNFTENDAYRYFIRNNGIFLRSWPGFIIWYKNNSVENLSQNVFDKAPLPHFKDGISKSTTGGWYLMISKYTTKKKEAVEFIKFLLSNEIQKEFYFSGYLPVTKNIYTDDEFVKQNPDIKFYSSLLKKGVRRPFFEKYTRYSDVISFYLNRALRKKMSVKEALSKAEQIINSELDVED